jgi:hypothetical protein
MFRPVLRRAVTGLSLVAALQVLRWGTWAPLAAAQTGTASFDQLVGLAAAFSCWVLLGWVMLVLAFAALGLVPGAIGRVAAEVTRRVTPVAMRRAARLALGLAVAAGPVAAAAPAVAGANVTRISAALEGPVTPASAQLPGIGRPGENAVAGRGPVSRPAAPQPSVEQTVPVRRGDCLWTVAASALGPAATNAEIAAEWPRWYAANRSVIGADPDLILPGMVLHRPTPQ